MTKRLKQQRRGKGKPKYRAPSHKYKAKAEYLPYSEEETKGKIEGVVKDVFHDPARSAPVISIKFLNNTEYACAPKNIIVGQKIEQGAKAKIKVGNVLPLQVIPEGMVICNIERTPGDGGKLVRSAGSGARLVSKEGDKIIIRLPSKRFKILNSRCRAMIGVIAGGGRKEKPIAKAGKKFHMMKAKAKIWPITVGSAMNPVDHPHGGGRRINRKKYTVKRTAAPGQKVGSIAAKRTGKRVRKVVKKW